MLNVIITIILLDIMNRQLLKLGWVLIFLFTDTEKIKSMLQKGLRSSHHQPHQSEDTKLAEDSNRFVNTQ